MRDLTLNFEGSTITGRGVDITAPFTFTGSFRYDGAVEIIKKYLGRHNVLYVGQYDGEGTFYGTWDIQGYCGQWSIKVVRPHGSAEDFDEVQPKG